LPTDIMESHPVLIEVVTMPLVIESIIFNGEKDTFDFIADCPAFEPVPDGELPHDYVFVFGVEDHSWGKKIMVGLERL